MTNDELFSQLLDKISSFDYIHADQIPNIDLYMDQVTTFMDTHLGATRRYDEDKVLTKTMINNYAKNNLLSLQIHRGEDGVSLLARHLFEDATDVNLFCGQAVNHAHDGLSIGFGVKNDLIKRLAQALGDMGKRVKISQC